MKVARRRSLDKTFAKRLSDDGYAIDGQGVLVRKKEYVGRIRERESFPLELKIPKEIKLPPVPRTGRGKGRQQILLTSDVANKILALTRIGLHKPAIAAAAGITRESLHKWLTKGHENIKAQEDGKTPPHWIGYTMFALYFDEAEYWAEIYMIKKMFEGAHFNADYAERFLARRFPERWGKVPGQDGNQKPGDTNIMLGVSLTDMLTAVHSQIDQRRRGIIKPVEINGRVLPADPRPPRALTTGGKGK